MTSRALALRNGAAAARADVPALAPEEFRGWLAGSVRDEGRRIAAYFGADGARAGDVELCAVLADDARGRLFLARTTVGAELASVVPDAPEAHLFEREIAEQWGVLFPGHPWMKPVRFHRAFREGRDAWSRPAGEPILPGVADFFRVGGDEVHEVAVGPVHAGVIEPGHFRFQCHGERVFHLEIALGYQHRGVERALRGGPDKRAIFQVEAASGDATVAHALAYAHVLEALAGTPAAARAHALRGIALELERLANHVGDLGALAGDVAYLPTASFCGRLRGDFLNMTAELCGSRFGRGLVRPGGAGFDLDDATAARLRERLESARRDVTEAVELLWETPSVVERFEKTGCVAAEDAAALGLVGPAARASGVARDVRHDVPLGIYRVVHLPVMTAHHGDVNSRAFVRGLEIRQSIAFLLDQLATLPKGEVRPRTAPPRPDAIAVALTEGWRGEVCHVAITDERGRFARYKIVDPSFRNWPGLALAMRGQPISDFPLCNKSFNLSYCGHDL